MENSTGWKSLLAKTQGIKTGKSFDIPAYSEFMPSPHLAMAPYKSITESIFDENDQFGWNITELEEELELTPGLASLAQQIGKQLVELGRGEPAYKISGAHGRNLLNNPYWPPELANRAGKLSQERYSIFLPLSLAKTQDDKGRIRWTFFGSSEQGPEKAFWRSFYTAPEQEIPADQALQFLLQLFRGCYHENCDAISDLHGIGFKYLPSRIDNRNPYWTDFKVPSYFQQFICEESADSIGTNYLLTFRPFSQLPAEIQKRYLNGSLVLLPFPGSLVFWGMTDYSLLQKSLMMAQQIPLQHLVARHGGPHSIRVPQSGTFHESGSDYRIPEVAEHLLLNHYKRTSRWDRVHRFENEVAVSSIEDTVGKVLFSTDLSILGLYGKPMARNSQLWNTDMQSLLDGPNADTIQLEKAAELVAKGGTFHYRFQFPPMSVGNYRVFWHRPLTAYYDNDAENMKVIESGPSGFLTAYSRGSHDLAKYTELWPKLKRRPEYLTALREFRDRVEHYKNQTTFNIVRILDTSGQWHGKPLPRNFTRQMLHLPEHQTLENWLNGLAPEAKINSELSNLKIKLEQCIEPEGTTPVTSCDNFTFQYTANREFEKNWWNDIVTLSTGLFVNKDNADCVDNPKTLAKVSHRHRDLEKLGDYLLTRHQTAIIAADMQGKAICGELPFHWQTDFDFSHFGGWKGNQEGNTHERDLLVIIPGKNHVEPVILADHYDTAYMEDIYDGRAGVNGTRISAPGADDNASATATLLQAAPVFLQLAKKGLLERDVWLLHLTGEEFPADCMGARNLARRLIENNLILHTADKQPVCLDSVDVAGVFIMDMIAHNRETEKDLFQISPGKGNESLNLAYQAHLANLAWNENTHLWNKSADRKGLGRGKRSLNNEIPQTAGFLRLQGEIRLHDDPLSTLFNTDGQIFSDCGIPVVLFMENYDISRKGYHDTQDTMANIDLDYGAALAAIAIESAARIACLKE
jgi:hypothetical protein